MQIQVNTDDNVQAPEGLVAHIESTVSSALDRFGDRITRLEIHLSDENGDKKGPDDKRCMMEARLAGHQPVAVTCSATTIDIALVGAIHKLKSSLDSTLGRIHDHR